MAARLGFGKSDGLQVFEREALAVGGLIFVRLSEHFDNGFARSVRRLAATHIIIPGYEMCIRAPPSLIVENGFDMAHFSPVHRVPAQACLPEIDTNGSLFVTGKLLVGESTMAPQLNRQSRPSADAMHELGLPATLHAFSPGLSILDVGGRCPYTMIIGATATPDGSSILRVSVGLARETYGDQPSKHLVTHLLDHSRVGIEADRLIWEHMSPTLKPRSVPEIDASTHRFSILPSL